MLYNVSSILAGVGAGFDIRQSSLTSKLIDNKNVPETMDTKKEIKIPFHNTYHGTTRHAR